MAFCKFLKATRAGPMIWLDDLLRDDLKMGVLNQGINSNTVTTEGTPAGQEFRGPPAIARFQRDVLNRPGVRSVIIFEGTNDLFMGVKAAVIHAGILSLVERAHAAGLCVVLGTMSRASAMASVSTLRSPMWLANISTSLAMNMSAASSVMSR